MVSHEPRDPCIHTLLGVYYNVRIPCSGTSTVPACKRLKLLVCTEPLATMHTTEGSGTGTGTVTESTGNRGGTVGKRVSWHDHLQSARTVETENYKHTVRLVLNKTFSSQSLSDKVFLESPNRSHSIRY